MASPIGPEARTNSKAIDVEALRDLLSEQVHKPTDEQYLTENMKRTFNISNLLKAQ